MNTTVNIDPETVATSFRHSSVWPTPLRWSGSGLRAISPRLSRSSPAPPATGSTARRSESTAESTNSTSPETENQ